MASIKLHYTWDNKRNILFILPLLLVLGLIIVITESSVTARKTELYRSTLGQGVELAADRISASKNIFKTLVDYDVSFPLADRALYNSSAGLSTIYRYEESGLDPVFGPVPNPESADLLHEFLMNWFKNFAQLDTTRPTLVLVNVESNKTANLIIIYQAENQQKYVATYDSGFTAILADEVEQFVANHGISRPDMQFVVINDRQRSFADTLPGTFIDSPQQGRSQFYSTLYDNRIGVLLAFDSNSVLVGEPLINRNRTLLYLTLLGLFFLVIWQIDRRFFRPIQQLTNFISERQKTLHDPKLALQSDMGSINRLFRAVVSTLESSQHQQKTLETILNSTMEAIVCLNSKGRVIEWNPAAERLFGYSRQDMLGDDISCIMSADNFDKHQLSIDTNKKSEFHTNKPKIVEARHADGRNLHVEMSVAKWVEEGESYYSAVVRDVDAIVRQKKLIQEVERQLTLEVGSDFLEKLVVGITRIYNCEYALIGLLNATKTRVTTIALAHRDKVIANIEYDLQGTPCAIVNRENSCFIGENIQEQFPEDQMLAELNIQSYNGVSVVNSREELIGKLVVMDTKPMAEEATDISIIRLFASRAATEIERLQADKELRIASQAFNTHEGIIITDSSATILQVNPAFTRITGYTSEEIVGQTAAAIQSDIQGPEFYKKIKDQLKSQGSWQGEIWNKDKSGRRFPMHMAIGAVYDGSGNIEYYVFTFFDNSEIKFAEKKIYEQVAEEKVLESVLTIGMHADDKINFLNNVVDILCEQIPWVLKDGTHSVFTVRGTKQSPHLINIADPNAIATDVCRYVRSGECLCGTALIEEKTLFTANLMYYPQAKMQRNQGVYAVPIKHNGSVIAVLQFGVDPGVEDSNEHLRFFNRLSATLNLCIDKMSMHEQLEYQAFHDALTGLPNRNSVEEKYNYLASLSARSGELSVLMYLDLNNFKFVNDTYGHQMGDRLLQEVVVRLNNVIRIEDMLARIGGDEFILLLPLVGFDVDEAAARGQSVAKKIDATLSTPFDIDGVTLNTGVSIGVVVANFYQSTYEDLLIKADAAMYSAKSDHGSSVMAFDDSLLRKYSERLNIERLLKTAIKLQEFSLNYQPQVDNCGRIFGAEALIRWNSDELGFVPPDHFIPIAETSGEIIKIGFWVVEQTCKYIRQLLDAGLNPGTISVNVSAKQIVHEDFCFGVAFLVNKYNVPPALLGIEITETSLLSKLSVVIDAMKELRQRGHKLSIDDFGTGYSSLSYLRSLPLDTLKIDRVFVSDIHKNPDNATLSEAIISIAHKFNLDIVVEGVEQEEEVAHFIESGCSKFQGYYYYKPMTEDDFTALIKTASKGEVKDIEMIDTDNSKSALVEQLLLEWHTDFEAGIEVIDLQHQEIFHKYNAMVKSYQNKEHQVANEGLEFLSNYVVEHFAAEEQIMADLEYPDFEKHKMSHQHLVDHLISLRSDLEQGHNFLSFEVILFMRKWLINHIIEEDGKIRQSLPDKITIN